MVVMMAAVESVVFPTLLVNFDQRYGFGFGRRLCYRNEKAQRECKENETKQFLHRVSEL